MTAPPIARRFDIQGIVQGVGFRPHVFTLARRYHLSGTVANTASGVIIQVEGTSRDLDAFHHHLIQHPPPLAHIARVSITTQVVQSHDTFTIIKSDGTAAKSALITPDTAVCDDCLQELFDPNDRRYRYPFINCTNCGPRYTIIDDIPYDRPNTSMRAFTMCSRCQAEYDNPTDRRFHAQPNACPVCGPRVSLFDHHRNARHHEDPIEATAGLLADGHIVALKGLGGFHLAVDATNETAVARLRRRKLREEKPLALMARDMTTIRRFAQVSQPALSQLTSRQRPIVLLPKKNLKLASSVAPQSKEYGVMLPYTPLHYLLLDRGPEVLVMTSANRTDEPIAIDDDDAFERLKGIADYFLIHDRAILLRSDDSLVRVTDGAAGFIRRARGYVPVPLFLGRTLPNILAVGAELKNTICLTKDDRAFISQHIGDLENERTYRFFKQTIDHLTRILNIEPRIVAHDMHPDYLNTDFAKQLAGTTQVAVQHHHAHIVSAMAENGISGPVIGLAFDGTGYGTDGTIWGGEIMMATENHFDRLAHLDYVPMPGSAAAIREPWRMAVSYLYATFGSEIVNVNLPFIEQIGTKRFETLLHMVDRGVNSPKTSSLGRLFDGVAALAGVRHRITFEGQAAMELEQMADNTASPYPYDWEASNDEYIICPGSIIRALVDDLTRGVSGPVIAGRFHATLIELFTELTVQISRSRGVTDVVLSGGVFQNVRLLTGLTQALYAEGLTVYTHHVLPANDGGICLGQAIIAAARTNGI